MISEEDLRLSAASLYRFVEEIVSECDRKGGPQAYSLPTSRFFSYISDLGASTLSYLDRFVDQAPAIPELRQSYADKLWNLRSSWSIFHAFVKPTRDADTLHVPTALLDALTVRVREIRGFEEASFAVFHTNEVNYLYVQANFLRTLTEKLGTIIPNSPPYPPHLGLIGIPYSQAESVFLNCLVAHEIGHYVFQDKRLGAERAILQDVATKVLEQVINPMLSKLDAGQVDWITQQLKVWLEELFCDLFAVCLIGPAYSMAYIEIFDLSRILAADSITFDFTDSHPADAFRLQQQQFVLSRTGWWDDVARLRCYHAAVLKKCVDLNPSGFTFGSGQPQERAALDAFLLLSPAIADSVVELSRGLKSCVSEFIAQSAAISDCFQWGVVPSTLVMEGGGRVCPEPVVLINAAYRFYLTNMPALIANVDDQGGDSIKSRSRWINRLELWTLKALEDHQLIEAANRSL